MEWKKKYSVGIHEIDEQHKTLIECISSLRQAWSQRERWFAVQSALGRLTSFAQLHFAVEESLMRILGYPRIEEHAEQHRTFLAELAAMQKQSLEADVSKDMIDFLQNWLDRHIPKHDKSYSLHFRQRATPD